MADGDFSPEIQARIDALPAAVREFLNSPEMGKVTQDIGGKHQLHIDQVGALEAEIISAMIGITEPEEFEENIKDVLDVDEQKAATITQDVNGQIFLKVRENMKAGPASAATQTPMSSSPAPSKLPPVSSPVATPVPAPAPKPAPSPMPKPPAPLSVPTSTPVAAPAPVPKPAPTPTHDLAKADSMLAPKPPAPAPAAAPKPATAPTAEAVKPQPYKADPYREPVE